MHSDEGHKTGPKEAKGRAGRNWDRDWGNLDVEYFNLISSID